MPGARPFRFLLTLLQVWNQPPRPLHPSPPKGETSVASEAGSIYISRSHIKNIEHLVQFR